MDAQVAKPVKFVCDRINGFYAREGQLEFHAKTSEGLNLKVGQADLRATPDRIGKWMSEQWLHLVRNTEGVTEEMLRNGDLNGWMQTVGKQVLLPNGRLPMLDE